MAEEHISNIKINSTNNFYTPQRRRQLFPTAEEDKDGLGQITPLNQSTPPNSPLIVTPHKEHKIIKDNIPNFNRSTISDYVILENINEINKLEHNENSPFIEKNRPQNITYNSYKYGVSPVHQSPFQKACLIISTKSPEKHKQTELEDTPTRKPSMEMETFKTPQESLSHQKQVPKLIRKTPFENVLETCESGKRKLQDSESPLANKHIKLDHSSKVRTALFTKISTSHFYSETKKMHKKTVDLPPKVEQQKIKNKSSVFLCGRKKSNKWGGQVNVGVRHKLKKPKHKKINDKQIYKTAFNILKKSSPTNYFKETQNLCKISHKKQIQCEDTFTDDDLNDITAQKAIDLQEKEISPEPDPNKKFFKFKRSRATVTVDKHIKLNVDAGKLSLMENKQPSKRRKMELKIGLDASDLAVPDDDAICAKDIDKILISLDNEKENVTEGEQIILNVHSSVTLSENAVQLHLPSAEEAHLNNKSVLLSPTSQMCSMTSDLALNSPKKAKQNLSNIINSLDAVNSTNTSFLNIDQEKLFPIFYGAQNNCSKNIKCQKIIETKKLKPVASNQLLLDAGQKRFGATQCPECELLYHMGDPNDEIMHNNYHEAKNTLRFWVSNISNILIKTNCSKLINLV